MKEIRVFFKAYICSMVKYGFYLELHKWRHKCLGLLKVTLWPQVYQSLKKKCHQETSVYFQKIISFQAGSLHKGLNALTHIDLTEHLGQCYKSKEKMKSCLARE